MIKEDRDVFRAHLCTQSAKIAFILQHITSDKKERKTLFYTLVHIFYPRRHVLVFKAGD